MFVLNRLEVPACSSRAPGDHVNAMIRHMPEKAEQRAQALFADAQERWREALEAHRTAPPDSGFSERLAALAAAARAEAKACREADANGFEWPPHRATESKPPYGRAPVGVGRMSCGCASMMRSPISAARPRAQICWRSPPHTNGSPARPPLWPRPSRSSIAPADCCPALGRDVQPRVDPPSAADDGPRHRSR